MKVKVFAPAKINLALHVVGQRGDGYHLLDTLVAFGSMGDLLTFSDDGQMSLSVAGPEAAGVPEDGTNLVLKAAALIANGHMARIALEKYLPSAAGIGGGSSDAAATLRALHQLWGTAARDPADYSTLGADVAMCLKPAPVRARGIGDQLEPLAALPDLPVVLVNPRVPVSTPQVFKQLLDKNQGALPQTLPTWLDAADFMAWLDATTRNDLLAPALALHPGIGDALSALSATQYAQIVRMSGSGATCFAVYPDGDSAGRAARKIAADRPDWWVSAGWMGDQAARSEPVVS